jgi:large conductance mechanosensitive channel
MRTLWNDFKAFAFKGSLVDVAVAFILGVAFGTLVQSLVGDVLTPLIGAIFGEPDFGGLTLAVGDGVIAYGTFLNALFSFVLVAFVLFLIVRAYQRATRPRHAAPEPASIRECPYCLTDISARASRCPNCTSQVDPVAA